jgi:hypothetical protein
MNAGITRSNKHYEMIARVHLPSMIFGAACLLPTIALGASSDIDAEVIAGKIRAHQAKAQKLAVWYTVEATQYLPPSEIERRLQRNAQRETLPNSRVGPLPELVECFWAVGFGKEYYETVQHHATGYRNHTKHLIAERRTLSWTLGDLGVGRIPDSASIHPGRLAGPCSDIRFPKFFSEDTSGNSLAESLEGKRQWNVVARRSMGKSNLYQLRDAKGFAPETFSEIWVDESRGFAKLRSRKVLKGKDVERVEVNEFIDVDGVWLPKSVKMETFWLGSGEPLANGL